MSRISVPGLLLALSVAVALGAGASAGAVPPEAAPAGPPAALPEDDAAAVPAAAPDCGIGSAGIPDRDGRAERIRRDRATTLFAPAHPSSLEARTAVPSPEGVVPADGGQEGATPMVRRANYVDDEILGALAKAGVAPAPLATDAEFLRRVTLDLTGRIPDAADVRAFLADRTPDKRGRTVDRLLASDAFADRWALFYDDLFRTTTFADSGGLGYDGRNAFHQYFVDSIRSRKGWDQVARELITSNGNQAPGTVGAPVTPPTNFVLRNLQNNGPAQDTYDNLAASTGTAFLGLNLFCTSCHSGKGHTDQLNLFLTSVGRGDFWAMSAFWSRSTLKRNGTTFAETYYTIGENATGGYALGTTTGNKTPRDGKVWAGGATSVTPRFVLNGDSPRPGEGYRAALARVVPSHPQFARAAVNYLWREMFAVGIVEPAWDFDLLRQEPSQPLPDGWTLQPTHPALLDRLADEFAASGYDIRTTLRTIARSSSYQLSSYYPAGWKAEYAPLFARHFVRRLRAEEVLDAVTRATGVPPVLNVTNYAAPLAWAGQLPDTSEPRGTGGAPYRAFLDSYLRGNRDSVQRSSEGSISQALSQLNTTVVTSRVKAATSGSTVSQIVATKATPAQAVDTLFLATLSRPPTPQERADALAILTKLVAGQTFASACEDLQFALLNKLDFLFDY